MKGLFQLAVLIFLGSYVISAVVGLAMFVVDVFRFHNVEKKVKKYDLKLEEALEQSEQSVEEKEVDLSVSENG